MNSAFSHEVARPFPTSIWIEVKQSVEVEGKEDAPL
jgi:hypothetical protein